MKQPQRTWHAVQNGGKWKVYDPDGKFRRPFVTKAEADAYVAEMRNGKRETREPVQVTAVDTAW